MSVVLPLPAMPMTMTAVGFDGFEDGAADDEPEEEAAGAGAGGEAEGALGSVDADMSASGAGPRRTRENRKRVCASAWSLYADSLGVVASAYLSNAASDSVAVSSEGSPEVHSRGPEPDRPTRAALRTRRPARGRIA